MLQRFHFQCLITSLLHSSWETGVKFFIIFIDKNYANRKSRTVFPFPIFLNARFLVCSSETQSMYFVRDRTHNKNYTFIALITFVRKHVQMQPHPVEVMQSCSCHCLTWRIHMVKVNKNDVERQLHPLEMIRTKVTLANRRSKIAGEDWEAAGRDFSDARGKFWFQI